MIKRAVLTLSGSHSVNFCYIAADASSLFILQKINFYRVGSFIVTTRNDLMSEVATELTELVWPEFYPRGVPPKTAVDAEGEFFRLVRVNPPTPKCFLSTHEEYPNRHKKCKGEALICVYGTSFFSDARGAIDAKAKFPAALGDRIVAKGAVMPVMGVMKKTFADPAHYTMWLKVNSSIHEHFQCLGEGE